MHFPFFIVTQEALYCLRLGIVTFFGRQNHDFKGHFDMTNWTYYRFCSKLCIREDIRAGACATPKSVHFLIFIH